MIIELLISALLVSGAACAIALIATTKEQLDERMFGANDDSQESYDW